MTAAPLNRTVMWLTYRQLFARQRLATAIILAVVPVLLALLYRFTSGGAADSIGFVSVVCSNIIIGVLMPITALIFGTAAFGGEVDDGTLIYLMVKPAPRWTLALSKYVVAVAATLAISVPSILVVWAVAGGAVPIRAPIAYAAGAVVGAIVYCAVFVTLGITSRRALALGLLYIIAFENVLSRNIAGARSLSVREFSLAVCKKIYGDNSPIIDPTVSMTTVLVMGSLMLAAGLALGISRLRRYEVAERL
jgi:ABC-2 type transport system permease protein